MTPVLGDEAYVFVTLPAGVPVPALASTRMIFHEAEGTTVILSADEAGVQGLRATFPCRMITLTVHSSLDAVGFMAAVAAALAAEGISTNPVAAFFHDHLFVPVERAEDAMRVLMILQERGAG
jgi:hypothetical protein